MQCQEKKINIKVGQQINLSKNSSSVYSIREKEVNLIRRKEISPNRMFFRFSLLYSPIPQLTILGSNKKYILRTKSRGTN